MAEDPERITGEYPQFENEGSHFEVYRKESEPNICLKMLKADLDPKVKDVVKSKIRALKTVSDYLQESNVFIPGFPIVFKLIDIEGLFGYESYFADKTFEDFAREVGEINPIQISTLIFDIAITLDLLSEVFGIENYDIKHDNICINRHDNLQIGDHFMITDWSSIFINIANNPLNLNYIGEPFSNPKVSKDAYERHKSNYKAAIANMILDTAQTLLPTNELLASSEVDASLSHGRYFDILFENILDKEFIRRRLINIVRINEIQTGNLSLEQKDSQKIEIQKRVLRYLKECLQLFD